MYLEDYSEGVTFQMPPVSLRSEEIIDYARIYDPRPIHVDPGAAKNSRFGGIIASGFHTLNACWSKWVHTKLDEGGLVAGMGMDNLRWLKPVYAHEPLYTTIVVDRVEVKEGGDYGVVFMHVAVRDEKGDAKMELDVSFLAASRDMERAKAV